MKMTNEEKLDIVIEAISEGKKITPLGVNMKLRVNAENRLLELELDEIASILYQLQDTHKIIKVLKLANTKHIAGIDPWADERDFFTIEPLDGFDRWASSPLNRNSNTAAIIKPKNPNPKYLRKATEKMWNLLQEIEEKRNITSEKDEISIRQVHLSRVNNDREALEAADERLNMLRMLENDKNAIKNVRWPHDHNQFVYFKIADNYFDVLDEYEETYRQLAENYETKKQKRVADNEVTHQTGSNSIVYEIKYTKSREIILNNNFQLAKPTFNSENDLVFNFLISHPNVIYSRKQIQEEIKQDINKEFHKIVENLGFKNDLKRVFFSISKNSIEFRNPVTKEDLKSLGLERIRIS